MVRRGFLCCEVDDDGFIPERIEIVRIMCVHDNVEIIFERKFPVTKLPIALKKILVAFMRVMVLRIPNLSHHIKEKVARRTKDHHDGVEAGVNLDVKPDVWDSCEI